MKNQSLKNSEPIVVDLDGTLIYGDCLHEQLNRAIFFHPLILVSAIWQLLQGKAKFKEFLSKNLSIDVTLLPYNEELIAWLKEKKEEGRTLVLATASNQELARRISDHVGIFDAVHASNDLVNLKGKAKAQLLNQVYGQYEYIGNSGADLYVWQDAVKSYYVGKSQKIITALKGQQNFAGQFKARGSEFKSFIRALRPHQWLKNILVFVPVVMAHQLSFYNLCSTFIAFLLFCAIASAGYLINDLSDVDSDRENKHKKKRSFASGAISLPFGWIVIPILLGSSLWVSFTYLPYQFACSVILYFILTILYTKVLKGFPNIDVFTLAFLYILRIQAGGYAVNISLSFWLITFSLFFFISLGMLKRFSELLEFNNFEAVLPGRAYKKNDAAFIESAGIASGYIAIAVLALYIKDLNISNLYQSPQYIWFVCPVMLYWITRVWFLAQRGELHHDPVYFAAKDHVSWLLTAIIALCFVMAKIY
ncbi:UbiA family prenyltransferase [Polynucleobacter sp. es-EL-1]|uniref:UbiA family prenyltransferase n=1 Tax=Polynucleobacter sp. es-EL-1 TaxID=1855652 RepID=UPI001BFDA913|nr:UbiA family prenyltransferase [Polynucleobacter sp. es-EL-1]QWE10863.1 UbiA family prenyltransferase [Polynucleobacter sp. es-EL-1]